MIQVRWTGAAGLEFIYDEQALLVDPYFTRVGLKPVIFGRTVRPDRDEIRKHLAGMKRIRGLVVSHTHFDHALDVPEVAGCVDGPVLGNLSLYHLMNAHGLGERVRVCRPGEEVQLDDQVDITMLPSEHGRVLMGRVPYPGEIGPDLHLPMKASGYRVGQVYAPKIRIGDTVFLHVGSAGFVEEALEGQTCDVLFLCVPGWSRMPGYPDRIIEKTRPGTVVLFHHDNFFKPLDRDLKAGSLNFIGMKKLEDRIGNAFPQCRLVRSELNSRMAF